MLLQWRLVLQPKPWAGPAIAIARFNDRDRCGAGWEALAHHIWAEFLCQHVFSTDADRPRRFSGEFEKRRYSGPTDFREIASQCASSSEVAGKVLLWRAHVPTR